LLDVIPEEAKIEIADSNEEQKKINEPRE